MGSLGFFVFLFLVMEDLGCLDVLEEVAILDWLLYYFIFCVWGFWNS